MDSDFYFSVPIIRNSDQIIQDDWELGENPLKLDTYFMIPTFVEFVVIEEEEEEEKKSHCQEIIIMNLTSICSVDQTQIKSILEKIDFVKNPLNEIFGIESFEEIKNCCLIFPKILRSNPHYTVEEFVEKYNFFKRITKITKSYFEEVFFEEKEDFVDKIFKKIGTTPYSHYYVPYIYYYYSQQQQQMQWQQPQQLSKEKKLEVRTREILMESQFKKLTPTLKEKIKQSPQYNMIMDLLRKIVKESYLNPPTKRQYIKYTWKVIKIGVNIISLLLSAGTNVLSWIGLIAEIIFFAPLAIRILVHQWTVGKGNPIKWTLTKSLTVPAKGVIKLAKLVMKNKLMIKIIGREKMLKAIDELEKIRILFTLIDSGEIWHIIPKIILNIPEEEKKKRKTKRKTKRWRERKRKKK